MYKTGGISSLQQAYIRDKEINASCSQETQTKAMISPTGLNLAIFNLGYFTTFGCMFCRKSRGSCQYEISILSFILLLYLPSAHRHSDRKIITALLGVFTCYALWVV
jgi:hypothetical protein